MLGTLRADSFLGYVLGLERGSAGGLDQFIDSYLQSEDQIHEGGRNCRYFRRNFTNSL